MSREAVYEQAGGEGPFFQELAKLARAYAVQPAVAWPLLAAGVALGALGDALLRAPGPPALNLSVWIASVAVAALALHRLAGLTLDRERLAWLTIGVTFAAGLSWRDAEVLKLLAAGSVILTFAIAAHRSGAAWVRRAGVGRYAGALALGAVHAWTAATLAIVDAIRVTPRVEARAGRWTNARAIVRGLVIAAPLVAIFGGLFVSADAAFEQLIEKGFSFDAEWVFSHVLPFSLLAWLSTGYLRGFLSGTDHRTEDRDRDSNWLSLGATEIATALAAIDLLFLVFVLVQFPYLFGADRVVQVTPHLTYAEYARRGFFELVAAVALVVPVLLAADWLLDRKTRRDVLVFRVLAGAQVGLVLAIAASALHRLRLYYASYGLTESRLYGAVLLVWMGAMLLWLAATVLRGRRDRFAFGTVASGLATIALLFAINPDALIAKTNVARMATTEARVRFDVAYATSLSADAVPVLMAALPALPADVQCPIARHMLRQWPPDRYRYVRTWNWSAWRASDAVRSHETQLRSMVGPELTCAGAARAAR